MAALGVTAVGPGRVRRLFKGKIAGLVPPT